MPHVFVADDAFALKPYLMKPYPQSGLTEERRIITTATAEPEEFQKISSALLPIGGMYLDQSFHFHQQQ